MKNSALLFVILNVKFYVIISQIMLSNFSFNPLELEVAKSYSMHTSPEFVSLSYDDDGRPSVCVVSSCDTYKDVDFELFSASSQLRNGVQLRQLPNIEVCSDMGLRDKVDSQFSILTNKK
nr:hypothetical protein HWPLAUVJ_HWPLAUVJ_CDS_0009 [Microvirus sp.]